LAGSGLAPAQTAPWNTDEPPEDAEYEIGIEDLLFISVWGEADLAMSVVVRPDGKVTFPLVNDIRVAGLTPNQVREAITERLATYVVEPHVTVIVEEIRSFRVYVLGEVVNQGALNFSRPTRLLQALAACGGFTEFSKRDIVVLRQSGQLEKRIAVNYKRLISGDPSAENLLLQPGDTLLVN
jgi:polysaccharide export outer membrane protein